MSGVLRVLPLGGILTPATGCGVVDQALLLLLLLVLRSGLLVQERLGLECECVSVSIMSTSSSLSLSSQAWERLPE